MVRTLQKLFAIPLLYLSYSVFSQTEPANHATGFTATATSPTAITLSWTDATGTPAPQFYLIVGRELPGGSFAAVADGPEVPADGDWSDGNFAAIVSHAGADNLNVTGLNPQTQYEFKIYSYRESSGNANYKTGGEPTTSAFTFSLEPTAHAATFTATLNGTVAIDLAFSAANTITNAAGYLIYRRAGSAVNLTGLTDGVAPPSPLNGATLIVTTTDSETAYNDTGLQGGVTYHYALVPFNFDGSNIETSNYRNDGAVPQASATTTLEITLNQLTGGVAASPLNSGSTDQAILGFSITTNGPTTLNALNVPVTTTPIGKFLNPRLFSSADNSFDGGDVSINSGTLTATQIQFSAIGQAFATAGTYHFFVVVNVTATVNASTPSIQPSFTQANISFISPAGTAQAITITGTDYSFVDATPPAISSLNPTNGATGVSVLLNQFIITFNESVVHIGDNSNDANRIRLWDDDANTFRETISIANISVAGNVVTITTTFALEESTNYDLIIGNNVFSDAASNNFPGIAEDNWEFQTEAAPFISSLSHTTRCIGDQLVITGNGFTGTGGSGSTKPHVRINGFLVPDANVTPYSATSITLIVPPGATTGNVTVENRDNFLISNSLALTVHPQINTGLTVTPSTLSPAQNTSVNIQIAATQTSYTYSLIATAVPGGYVPTTPNQVTGDGTTKTLTTDPSLSFIGDYTYRIDVSRTGCTTRTLSNTPFTLTVAPLSVNVTASKTTICNGESIYLIASTSGGTGFVQFNWTSTPPGFSSNSSSPLVTPSSNVQYNVEVTDNANNVVNGFVDIVVNPLPTVSIIPAPDESTVRTKYTIENRDYQLYGSPTGGVFSGQGVILKSDGNYYFNPLNAGVGTWPITYTFTDVQGCSNNDVVNFQVSNAAITNLALSYCRNNTDGTPLVTVGPLSPNSTFPTYHPVTNSSGYQFTRLVFFAQLRNSPSNYCIAEVAPNFPFCGNLNPLSVDSSVLVQDISQPPGVLFSQPVSYTLNLDIVRNNYGYSTDYYFYILAYGRNTSGFETFLTFQYFDVFNNGPLPSITGISENENICSDGNIISLDISESGYTINNFSIAPSTFNGALSGTNNRDFNPGHSSLVGADERYLTIYMLYRDLNNCPNTVSRNFNWIKKPDTPTVLSDPEYCQIPNPPGRTYQIIAVPNGSATNANWYNQDPVSNPATPKLDSINFNFTVPGIDGLTPVIQTFYVSQSNKGCEGDAISTSIEIKPAPNATFTIPAICAGREFTITGPTNLGVPYAEYTWSFDPSTSITLADNNLVSYTYPPEKGNQQISIQLRVKTDRNCENTFTNTAIVGLNPVPDLRSEFICENDLTRLISSSSVVVPTEFEWDFGDGTPPSGRGLKDDPFPTGGTYENPQHIFLGGAGVYNVTLTAYSAIGCFNTIVKPVRILEYLNLTTPYRMENINGGDGFWTVEDINGNSTWQFSQPTSSLFSQFASAAWVTNPIGSYAENEKSFINSPCFDFSAISRPVLSIDYMVNTPDRVDGAVLEYSEDGGLTWASLGNLDTNPGLNWFNTTGWLLGNIGSSPVGWSGIAQTEVFSGKHALDFIGNKTQTRFRIAFASGPGDKTGLEGFAFNKVNIETRNRNMLAENFSQDHSSFSANNNAFAAISSSEAVKLQYNIGFPNTDNLYLENTADPSSRVAFYGISNSPGLVPRAYIDGYSEGNFTGAWNTTYRTLRTLVNSPVTISINTLPRPAPDTLQFTVTVSPISGITSGVPIVHAVVIEKIIGNNHAVVRKMLPNAAGIPLPLPHTSPVTLTYKWRPEISFDPAQLAIVAFVQDQVTKEVYQAAELLTPNPAHLPDPLITTIEDPSFTENIQVYPNPASHELNVVLPEPAQSVMPFALTDAQGRTVLEQHFNPGQQATTINTSDLAGGLYVLQLRTKTGTVRKKVMVVRGK